MKINKNQVLQEAIVEIDAALDKVMENINDNLTDGEKMRKISVVIDINPTKTASNMMVKIRTEQSLAPREVRLSIEQIPEGQQSLYDEEEG